MLKRTEPSHFVGFRWFNNGFNFARDHFGNIVAGLSRRLVLSGPAILVVFVCDLWHV